MKIGIIAEGDTEYACLPTLVAKRGHQVVFNINLGGIPAQWNWEKVFSEKVFPFVRAAIRKDPEGRPEKILIVLDREDRGPCCGGLATIGHRVLLEKLREDNIQDVLPIAIILANPQIECWLFAQPELLNSSSLFTTSIADVLGAECNDGRRILNVVNRTLRNGKKWDKVQNGKALAQRIDLDNPKVLERSRSLRKFVKEIS
jgi:hypothetical protein